VAGTIITFTRNSIDEDNKDADGAKQKKVPAQKDPAGKIIRRLWRKSTDMREYRVRAKEEGKMFRFRRLPGISG
jgi:hypothetical protein